MKTLRMRLLAFSVVLVTSLAGLLAWNNYMAVTTIRERVHEVVSGTVSMYQREISAKLDNVDSYLITFIYDNKHISQLGIDARKSIDWFSAAQKFQKEINASVSIYGVDSFFFINTDQDVFITCSANNDRVIYEVIRKMVNDGSPFTPQNAGKWMLCEIDGKHYLFRLIKYQGSYIGAWVAGDTILSGISDVSYGAVQTFLGTGDGVIISSIDDKNHMETISTNQSSSQLVMFRGEKYLMISKKLHSADVYLVSLVADASLQSGVHEYMTILYGVLAGLFLLLLCSILFMMRTVLRPVKNLTKGIRRLQSGDIDFRIKEDSVSSEFAEMNKAFNEMVAQIKTLRIEVYEEKLERQQIKMDYLKLQITPHFLINCLNMIYQLSENDRFDLSRQMALDLSRHLRYTLSSHQFVPLEDELAHVRNYIELSGIRYPSSIKLHIEQADDTCRCTVIPLIVQSFVENTVKYEAAISKTVHIYVQAYLVEENSRKQLFIRIWDTGAGFSPDILAQLQDIPTYLSTNKNKRIGISNVLQRAVLLFPDCSFTFSNRPGEGAQIEILLPNLTYNYEETFDESINS